MGLMFGINWILKYNVLQVLVILRINLKHNYLVII